MSDRDSASDVAAATGADRSRQRAVAAGRWFARYLVLLGLASAVVVVVMEAFFPDGLARALVGLSWLVVMLGLSWWAERQLVYPRGATRAMWASLGSWLVLYLLVVGPLVRWRFDQELLPWVLAAVAMSTPFLVAAGWVLRRR
jgi:hypothetical protein